eukprot:4637241-Prymnesium_polylepis.2
MRWTSDGRAARVSVAARSRLAARSRSLCTCGMRRACLRVLDVVLHLEAHRPDPVPRVVDPAATQQLFRLVHVATCGGDGAHRT